MNHFKNELIKGLMLIALMLIVLTPGFLLTSACSCKNKSTQEICQGWNIGDVVKLKIGSPEMVVVDLWQFGKKCHLEVVGTSSEGEAETARYPVKILKKVESASNSLY